MRPVRLSLSAVSLAFCELKGSQISKRKAHDGALRQSSQPRVIIRHPRHRTATPSILTLMPDLIRPGLCGERHRIEALLLASCKKVKEAPAGAAWGQRHPKRGLRRHRSLSGRGLHSLLRNSKRPTGILYQGAPPVGSTRVPRISESSRGQFMLNTCFGADQPPDRMMPLSSPALRPPRQPRPHARSRRNQQIQATVLLLLNGATKP